MQLLLTQGRIVDSGRTRPCITCKKPLPVFISKQFENAAPP